MARGLGLSLASLAACFGAGDLASAGLLGLWSPPCRPRLLDSATGPSGLTAWVFSTECRGPGARLGTTQVSVGPAGPVGDRAERQEVVWYAHADGRPELLHDACGGDALAVRLEWVGPFELRIAYDARARVLVEKPGPASCGATVALWPVSGLSPGP